MSDEKLPEKDKEITSSDPKEETTPTPEVPETPEPEAAETPASPEPEKSEEPVAEAALKAEEKGAEETEPAEDPVTEKTETAEPEKEEKPAEATADPEKAADTPEDKAEESPEEKPEEKKVEIDYGKLSQLELIEAFRGLLKAGNMGQIKNEVDQIRSSFNGKFQAELDAEKEKFLAEGGNEIDFHYTTPLRKQFNSVYFEYKEKRADHYKKVKKDLQANLEKRQELIEELKGLLSVDENINTTYKHFKEIQDQWHIAGPIPRDQYNTVWNTYRHHVENFYDFLHLNREFRDLDFKHNLEKKLRLIGRAEELGQEENVPKAFRELQTLHKVWKEEIGPVAKEHREEIWKRFSDATQKIHDRREAFLKDQDVILEANYEKKQAIVDQISDQQPKAGSSHQAWQQAIKRVQKLRDEFFELGPVPRTKNKELWNQFKDATRDFNRQKNNFYKDQKKDQFVNLEKKRELVKIAHDNKDSDDFETTTALMKKIQQDWKKIGHVPRKESDKIWKEFKEACNNYFDRVHGKRNQASKQEEENLVTKQAMLEEIKGMKLSGEKEADLETIREKMDQWKAIGRVPIKKKNIDQQFNKAIDAHLNTLKLDKQQSELFKFEAKVNTLVAEADQRKLNNEEIFLRKKIDEVKKEIGQLENNLGFFQHVADDNPLVAEVHKNIGQHKTELEKWKDKLKTFRVLTRPPKEEPAAADTAEESSED
ncbi:DUF349 domain-containing protein [Aureitalea marina]|uniref:Chromosome segregation protein n=1 Tax=Aureitalea marina TaxID=930804 RepID=A0A2S7KQ10_9FLAO|nr:DUF349 domain-containing protein [Aureitalea marina]PQB04716.1 chromosome segregation protein [Aureitalea marina]